MAGRHLLESIMSSCNTYLQKDFHSCKKNNNTATIITAVHIIILNGLIERRLMPPSKNLACHKILFL